VNHRLRIVPDHQMAVAHLFRPSALLAITISTCCLHLLTPVVTLAKPQDFNPSRWTIKVFGSAAPGSGVIVESNASGCLALTAAHVVSGTTVEEKPYTQLTNGRRFAITAIRLLPPLDLAELELQDCAIKSTTIAQSRHRGGTVMVAGFPQESTSLWIRSGPSEAQGTTPAARNGGYAILHAAQTQTGISGGGLYDSAGRLIGIHGEADITVTGSGKSYKSGVGLAIPISFWLELRTPNHSQNQHPDPQSDPESTLQNKLLRLAWLESAKRRSDALSLATSIIIDNPDDPRARIKRAGLYMSERKFADALNDYNILIGRNPGNASLRINRGNALLALGRPSEALSDYDQALFVEPRLAWGYLNRAKVMLQLDRTREAAKDIERALQLAPGDPAALSERASLRQRLGQLLEASHDLTLLLAQRPDDAEILARRGLIRGELGDYAGSIDDLTDAIRLQPDKPEHLLNRGVTLARMKRLEAAEQDLRQVMHTYGDSPLLLANLGEVIYLNGRQQEACSLALKAERLGFQWSHGQWDMGYLGACASSQHLRK
jgi:tetratricopeptide (TPR) repeat protein